VPHGIGITAGSSGKTVIQTWYGSSSGEAGLRAEPHAAVLSAFEAAVDFGGLERERHSWFGARATLNETHHR